MDSEQARTSAARRGASGSEHGHRPVRLALATLAILASAFLILATFANAKLLIDVQSDRGNAEVSSHGNFDDYVAFYAAGVMVLDGNGGQLYDTEAMGEKEREIMGRPVGGTGSLGFFNPPFVAVAFAPLSAVSPATASLILLAANLVLAAGATVMVASLLNVRGLTPVVLGFVVALSFDSLLWVLVHGQLSLLLFAGLLGFFWFLRQSKPVPSGLALALVLVKPQMAVLPVLVLIWRRDWQALASFSAVAFVLVLVSVAVAGPSALWDYPSFALSSTGWDMEHGINVERMYGWNGMFANLVTNHSTEHLLLTTVATVATVALVLRAFDRAAPDSGRFAAAFGAMVAGAILINPHIYLQDLVLMALILLGGYLGTKELGRAAPFWLAAAALTWLTQELADQTFALLSVGGPSLLVAGLLGLLLWSNSRWPEDVTPRQETQLAAA